MGQKKATMGLCGTKLSAQLHLNENVTVGVDVDFSKREQLEAVKKTVEALPKIDQFDPASQARLRLNAARIEQALKKVVNAENSE